jgi:hypothetical protein
LKPVGAQFISPSILSTNIGSGSPEQRNSKRRLLTIEQVAMILNIAIEKVQQLIATRQLKPIRICGEERIDSMDVDSLISTYKRTAMRQVGVN